MEQDIKKALEQFHTLPGSKRGLLLTAAGAFLLFDSKFIPIASYHIILQTEEACIDSNRTPFPIFAGLCWDGVAEHRFLAARGAAIRHMSVMFHIMLGAEDELLRGILFAQEEQLLFALFSDPAIEEIFEAVNRAPVHQPDPVSLPDVLLQRMEQHRRQELRRLTALYLNGKPWEELPDVIQTET